MPQVLDPSGATIGVKPEELLPLWQQGKVQLVPGQRYDVRLPDGRITTVPAENMAEATGPKYGAVPLEAGAAAERERDLEYRGVKGGVIAAAGGALEQGTLGLGAALLPDEAKQAIAESQPRHPYATLGGEAIGALGLSAVLPGGGLAGIGERLGAAAVEGVGETALSRIAARATISGLRDAAAGAQFGASQAIGDAYLKNAPLSAEHVLASIGGNALWGLGLGAGFGALGAGLGEGRAAYHEASLEPPAKPEVHAPPVDPAAVAAETQAFGGERELRQVPIRSIVGNRDVWDPAKLADASDKLASGSPMPPVRLDADYRGTGYTTEDGIHRLNAAEQAGYTHIPAMVPKSAPRFGEDVLGATGDSPMPRAATEGATGEVAGKVLGAEPSDGLGRKAIRWYSKLASIASGKDANAIERFASDPQARRAVVEAEASRATATRSLVDSGNEILDASRQVQEEGRGAMKLGYVRKALLGVDDDMAAKAARDLHTDVVSTLQRMAADSETFGGKKPLSSMLTLANRADRELAAAAEDGDVARQFMAVDNLKRQLGKYTQAAATTLQRGGGGDELARLQLQARFAETKPLYEKLRVGLEDEDVWAEAGAKQRQINAAWTQQIDASKRFRQALTTYDGRAEEDPWLQRLVVDPAKAERYTSQLSNPAQDLTHKAVTDYVSSTRALADAFADAYDLPPAKLAQVERLKDAADVFSSTIDKHTEELSLANQFAELTNRTEGHGLSLAAGALGLTHGLGGGVAGLALGRLARVFTHPAETMMQLARVEQMQREGTGRIARALRGFARGGGPQPTKVDLTSYARRAAEVQRAATDAAGTQARMGAMLQGIQSRTPKLSQALTQTSLASLTYLQSKLPPQPPMDPLAPLARVPDPPVGAQEKFLRYYQAVRDPISVVEDARHGRLSLEGVETLKTVYPGLYKQVQEAALDAIGSGKYDYTSQQRLGLGLLLDLPLPELAPQYLAARQATYAAIASPPAQPQASKRQINIQPPALAGERQEAQASASP